MNQRDPQTFFQSSILLVLITFSALLPGCGSGTDSTNPSLIPYNTTGPKMSETDTLGKVTKYEYSPLDCEFKKIVKPDGSTETFSYQELLNKQINKIEFSLLKGASR